MANKFHLKVITPNRTAFEDSVEMVDMPGVMGKIAFLSGHMPYITALKDGWMRVRTSEGDKPALVFDGFARIEKNEMILTASYFEWAEDINDAEEQLRNAELKLEQAQDNKYRLRIAELDIRRANVRMEVSTYSIIRGRVNKE